METENIFEGFEPAKQPTPINTLANGTYIKAGKVPDGLNTKGRKTYEIECTLQSDGVITKQMLVMGEKERAAFAANPYQMYDEKGLTPLTRKA